MVLISFTHRLKVEEPGGKWVLVCNSQATSALAVEPFSFTHRLEVETRWQMCVSLLVRGPGEPFSFTNILNGGPGGKWLLVRGGISQGVEAAAVI